MATTAAPMLNTTMPTNLKGYAPTATVSGSIGSLKTFEDPYTNDVINSAIKNLKDTASQQQNTLDADAFTSGAYGDGRHGVESANIASNTAKNAGDLTAQLKDQDFTQAMAGLTGDVDRTNANFNTGMGWLDKDTDRQLSTQEFNAGLDQSNTSNILAELGLQNQLSNSALGDSQNYADAVEGLDQYDRGNQQQVDNTNYQDWLDKNGYDATQLTQFMNFINGTPGQTGTSSSTPDNSWANVIGAALGNIKPGQLFGNGVAGGTNVISGVA